MSGHKKQSCALPVCITGAVVSGKRLGRELGFPTANQNLPTNTDIAHGIYVSTVELEGIKYMAVSNVGTRPTVEGAEVNCESHILGFSGELYGSEIKTTLLAFLREERCFSSVEELRAQIAQDAEHAKEYFQKHEKN